MTDLTERLAAKLGAWTTLMATGDGDKEVLWLSEAANWLPLLLSEPELVASLSDEVRLSVLTPRERAVMKLGEAQLAESDAYDVWVNDKFGNDALHDAWYAANCERDAALALARALSPSPTLMEGRSNE